MMMVVKESGVRHRTRFNIMSPIYRTSSLERLFDWGLLMVPEPVIAVFGIRGLCVSIFSLLFLTAQ